MRQLEILLQWKIWHLAWQHSGILQQALAAALSVYFYIYITLLQQQRCNSFFPFVCRSVRGWPEALGISALDYFADPWLFWQCHPVRSTVTSILGTDLPMYSSNCPCQPCTPSQRLHAGCCLHVLSDRCWCWRWHQLLLSLNWHWAEVGLEELAEVVCLWWMFSSVQLLTHAGDSWCFPPEAVEVSPDRESLPRWWHDFKVLSRQVPVWASLSWTGGTSVTPCL